MPTAANTVARYIHKGDSIDYTPTTNIFAGQVVFANILGKTRILGIAKLDIPANTLGALATTGVFDIDKVTGQAVSFVVGQPVGWLDTNGVTYVGASDTSTTIIGVCVKTANDMDPTVRVRLTI